MNGRNRPEEHRLHGIIGNAIAIPIENEPTAPRTPKFKAPSTGTRAKTKDNNSAPVTATSTTTGCTCGLSDKLAKCQSSEREARAKVELLSRSYEDLKKEIEKNIAGSNESLRAAETKWKVQLEALESKLRNEINAREDFSNRHAKCDEKIAQLNSDIAKLRNDAAEHANEIARLKRRHEDELATLRKDRDEQIASREEKISKMKTQIADKLTGNSSERQKQIDDLLKEMSRLQEEHEVLKAKLRVYGHSKNVQAVCDNCTTSNARVKVLEERLKDRELLVTELRAMCEKFDRQLKQNDHLVALSSEFDKNRAKKK